MTGQTHTMCQYTQKGTGVRGLYYMNSHFVQFLNINVVLRKSDATDKVYILHPIVTLIVEEAPVHHTKQQQ